MQNERIEEAIGSLETLTEVKPADEWDKSYFKEKEARLRFLMGLVFQYSESKNFLDDREKEILLSNRGWLQKRRDELSKQAEAEGHELEFYMVFMDNRGNCLKETSDCDLSNPYCYSVRMPYWMRNIFAIKQGPPKPNEFELELQQRKRELLCLSYISKGHNLDKIASKMNIDTVRVIALIERMQRENKVDIKGFSLAKLKKQTKADRKENLALQLTFRGQIEKVSDFTEEKYRRIYGDDLD